MLEKVVATESQLPPKIYRLFLMTTNFWEGARIRPGSLLVKVHSGGDAAPFFWAGTPEDLNYLPKYIGEQRSIYCINGTFGLMPPTEENIKSLARYFAGEILQACPDGPFLFGGHCSAAMIPYEIAKIFAEQGREIGLMIFTERDTSHQDLPIRICRRIYSFIENSYLWRQKFKNDFADALKQLGKRLSSAVPAESTEEAHYYLSGYNGKVDLIYVRWGLLGYFSFKYFQNYWKELALQGATFHIIEGKKHTPNWEVVAQLIKKQLLEKGL